MPLRAPNRTPISAAVVLGAAVLLLIAWRLLRGYFRDKWSGYSQPSLWQLPWAAVSATAGGGMLWLLWRDLEHTATRMGVGVAVLVTHSERSPIHQ